MAPKQTLLEKQTSSQVQPLRSGREMSLDTRSNYTSLNGLRFIAAMAVVAFHYLPPTGSRLVNTLAQSGPTAVGFFFLLSGFVLAHRHPAPKDLKSFWRARFIRIYPMYFLAFLLFLPIAILKYHHHLGNVFLFGTLNLFMLQAWTPFSQSWNGPSWSLSVEAFLYLSFPILVTRIAKVNSQLLWAVFATVPAVVTFFFCNDTIPAHFWRSWVGNNPLFWIPVFCFGISLGLWRSAAPQSKLEMDIPLGMVLLCLIVSLTLWPLKYREVYINGGAALLLGLLVVLATYRTRFLGYLLGNKAMDTLGKGSYITYIIQAPVWHYWHAIVNHFKHRAMSDEQTSMAEFFLFATVLVSLSFLLDKFFDEPFRQAINRRRARVSLQR